LLSRTNTTLSEMESLMRTVKESIRNGVDLTNSYKLNSLINDLGFNLSTMQR